MWNVNITEILLYRILSAKKTALQHLVIIERQWNKIMTIFHLGMPTNGILFRLKAKVKYKTNSSLGSKRRLCWGMTDSGLYLHNISSRFNIAMRFRVCRSRTWMRITFQGVVYAASRIWSLILIRIILQSSWICETSSDYINNDSRYETRITRLRAFFCLFSVHSPSSHSALALLLTQSFFQTTFTIFLFTPFVLVDCPPPFVAVVVIVLTANDLGLRRGGLVYPRIPWRTLSCCILRDNESR